MTIIKRENNISPAQNSLVFYWLILCCLSIFGIIIVGAITRLTESGLSIVEWKPLIGAIPPLNEEEWEKTFMLYKATPEFQKKNFWMEIGDFKKIFFWEWFHRLLGRLIGLIFAIPFFFFLFTKKIPQGFKLKFFGLLLLGGLQGFMGWYMVKSGLVNQPAVSHYRLAAHLSLALLIYSLMLWHALSIKALSAPYSTPKDKSLFKQGVITLCFIIITIFWGAFTAGLDAGLIYNQTFPKMGENWIPSELWFHQPLWLNFFEISACVQFTHRWLAIITALAVLIFAVRCIQNDFHQLRFALLGFFIVIQIGLGIATLLSGVNIILAVMHQGGAVIILTLMVMCLHQLRGDTEKD